MLPSQQWRATVQLAVWARPACQGVEVRSPGATPPTKSKKKCDSHTCFLLVRGTAAALTTHILLHHRAPSTPSLMLLYLSQRQLKITVQRKGMRFRKRPLFTFVQNTVTHGYVTHLLLGQKLPENHAGVHTAKSNWMLNFIYYLSGHT